jgi:predicted HicB family RNase H-like nuclease
MNIAMAIAIVERAVDRELIGEEFNGLIAYFNTQKTKVTEQIQEAQDKLDEWEDMVDYRGMSKEEIDKQEKEDNDILYRAAKKLLDKFNA